MVLSISPISSSSSMEFQDLREIELPDYSTPPVPAYSCSLRYGERSLQTTRRAQASRTQPTGVFLKKAGKVTITLEEQENGIAVPVYGLGDVITGSILLESTETVLDVSLKVEGKMQTTSSNGGGASTRIIDDTYKLWSHSSTTDVSSTCPNQIPFSVILPSTFRIEENRNAPLPPTFNIAHYELPSLFVRTAYQLHVTVSKRRLHNGAVGEVWPKNKHILVPFKYAPRTRPSRPIFNFQSFFTSIKSTPEEWHQAVQDMKMRSPRHTNPQLSLSAHLFIPASRVYGRNDKIPFHVQLSGNVELLHELFSGPDRSPELELGRVGTADSQSTAPDADTIRPSTLTPSSSAPAKAVSTLRAPQRPLIRVTLVRQVSLVRKSSATWKNSVLHEAHVTPVPPSEAAWYEPWYKEWYFDGCWYDNGEPAEDDWVPRACTRQSRSHLDWEGVICVDEQTKDVVSGFQVGNVTVSDFITLAVSPPPRGRMVPLQLTVPVRIVTESFEEDP